MRIKFCPGSGAGNGFSELNDWVKPGIPVAIQIQMWPALYEACWIIP
jgi:hypothetical protein